MVNSIEDDIKLQTGQTKTTPFTPELPPSIDSKTGSAVTTDALENAVKDGVDASSIGRDTNRASQDVADSGSSIKDIISNIVGTLSEFLNTVHDKLNPPEQSQTPSTLGVRGDAAEESLTKVATAADAAATSADTFGTNLQTVATNTETLGTSTETASTNAETFGSSLSNATSALDSFVTALNQAAEKANSGSGSGGATVSVAGGGHIWGPGTETSDSIPAWLSRNEFVQRAAAVNYYGVDFMHAINNLQMPKFAAGGLVNLMSPQIPRFASGGVVTAGAPAPHLGTVDLRTDHGNFQVAATPNTATQLQRLAVTKRITATGRKPGFIG